MNASVRAARRRLSFVIVVLSFVVAATSCRRPREDATDNGADVGVIAAPDDVALVQRTRVASGPSLSGWLAAERTAVLRAEVGGRIVAVGAAVGERVKKGTLLARVAQPAISDTLGSAREAVRAAERDRQLAVSEYERTRRLVESGAIARSQLETAANVRAAAEARLQEARARVASVSEEAGSAFVRSPFAGIISARTVREGDIVAAGAELFTVIDPASMQLEAAVPAHELGALHVGAKVSFDVRGYPGRVLEGTIERIAPAADPITHQIAVFVSIPNPEGALVGGLFAEGRVIAEERHSLSVPLAAIEDEGADRGRAELSVVRNGRVEHVPIVVTLRDERAGRVAIEGAVEEGERVLVGPARDVAHGTAITILEG